MHYTLFAAPLGFHRKPVCIYLLFGFAPQLDPRVWCLLLAVVLVLAVAGALGLPDAAPFHHLDDGLKDGDTGGNDDEVSFNTVQGYD